MQCNQSFRPLLDGDTGIDRSVEELFEKADASLAQVREAIPITPGVEGAFHFVDARSPDHSHKVSKSSSMNGLPVLAY